MPVPGAVKHLRSPGDSLTGEEWNARYGNVATNTATCNGVYAKITGRFGAVRSGGIYNCRKQRGTGSDPTDYSVHSVAGALDVWPGSNASAGELITFAKSLPEVWDAWLDESPGDVHIQVVPNPPEGWVPPCAGGSGGGSTVVPPPGAIMAATALKAAKCPAPAAVNMVGIAYRESRWNPTAHTFGQGCGPGECGRHNGPGTVCEDSSGLWQINWCAHGETLEAKGITRTMLLFASTNAKAAGIISGGFKTLEPWRGTTGVSETTMAQAKAAVDAVYLGIGVDDQCAKLWADWIRKGSKGPAPDCSFSVEGDPTSAIPDAFGWVGDLVGKFIAALGIGLAAGVILFGAYLIVRSSQGRTVREVGTSLASPFRALGGRSSRGRASGAPRARTTSTPRVTAPKQANPSGDLGDRIRARDAEGFPPRRGSREDRNMARMRGES